MELAIGRVVDHMRHLGKGVTDTIFGAKHDTSILLKHGLELGERVFNALDADGFKEAYQMVAMLLCPINHLHVCEVSIFTQVLE